MMAVNMPNLLRCMDSRISLGRAVSRQGIINKMQVKKTVLPLDGKVGQKMIIVIEYH